MKKLIRLLNIFCAFILIIFTLIIITTDKASALNDPRKNWKTISTPHFEIIYDANQQELARMYALRAEYTFSLITPHLTEHPEKTIMIINDSTDLANGYATRIPYPHVMIYPVLPTPMDSIAEYGDWSHELFLHEYTHILSFEPAHGFIEYLRSAFGTIMSPNMLMPRWWLEGFAVEFETRFSHHGRLRSTQQDASLRALEIDSQYNLFSISEINESDLPTWPRGARPYVFGSLLMSELISNSGTKSINDITQAQGGRVPYFIEGPVIDLTEKDYIQWFSDSLLSTQILVQNQLEELRKKPTTVFTKIDFDALESKTPTISPNGQYLSLIYRNKFGKTNMKMLDRKDEKRTFDFTKDSFSEFNQGKEAAYKTMTLNSKIRLDGPFNLSPLRELATAHTHPDEEPLDAPPGGSINRMSWNSDSTGFVFDRVKFVDAYQYSSDVYFYDIDAKKTTPLTFNLRAREPDISPSGMQIAFVHTEGGSSTLGITTWNEPIHKIASQDKSLEAHTEYQTLFTPPAQNRISSPMFLNENTILFIWRKLDGSQNLYQLTLTHQFELPNLNSSNSIEVSDVNLKITDTTASEPILVPLKNLQQINFLQRSPKGIIFTAQENGTSNIYTLSDNLKEIKRLTHVETAAFDSTYDMRTNELYATLIASNGFQVKKTNLVAEDLKNQLPNITPVFEKRYPTPKEKQLQNEDYEKQFGSLVSENKEYKSSSYLKPTYWLPFVYFSGTGYGTQISTSAQDPLDLQDYTIQAGWDSYVPQTSLSVLYNNNTFTLPMTVLFSASQLQNPIQKNQTDQIYSKLLFTKDLKPWSDSLSVAGGLVQQQVQYDNTWSKFGPELNLIYNNVSTNNFSPVPAGGSYATLTYDYFIKTQSTYHFDKTLLEAGYYYSKDIPLDGTLFVRTKAQYLNSNLSVINQTFDFTGSETFPLTNSLISSGFILRGYDTNYLIFNSGANLTFEYSFPFVVRKFGINTIPLFIKRSRLHFYTDLMAANGIKLDATNLSYHYMKSNEIFSSFGGEVKFDTTLGYYFPISWVLGLYVRPQYTGIDKLTSFLGLQM